ncbi:TolC family protein [Pedobacter sp.]|uniref:TolC family protein n=1 Tax=Pedobacter sp. TaxID=1411316 RepID=UPI003D7FC745
MIPHNKIGLLIGLALQVSSIGFAQQKHDTMPLSLPEVWQKAEKNNKIIKMQYLKLGMTEEVIKNAKVARLPEISVGGEYARVSNMPIYEQGLFKTPTQGAVVHTLYGVGANAYLNLYHGHKTKLKLKQADEEKQLAEVILEATTADVKFVATSHFLAIKRDLMFKALLLQNISDQQKQLEEIRELRKNGVVLKSDVLRAELKLSRQKMSLIEIDNNLVLTNQKLGILIGEKDDFMLQPIDKEQAMRLTQTYEGYLEEAYLKSHEYKISETETALSKLALKAVKSGVSLKLGLFANYNYSYPQLQFYPYSVALYGLGMAGLKASFPISALYHNKHKTSEAKLALMRQEEEHHDVSDQVRQRVKEAYLRYEEAITRIAVAEENIIQAKENLRIVNNTYFNQLSLLTDLLDADTQLLQTRFDLAAAQIAAQLQYFQLQKAIGTL